VKGQNLYALHALWDDDLKQWTLECNEGDLEGSIEMRWRMKNDISVWDYNIDGQRGTISQVWDNNPNFWELRAGSELVTISTIYTGDFTSFRIKQGDLTIMVERTNYNADPIEWTIRNESEGLFYWYNEFEFDLRDWVIVDELSDNHHFELKLASVFTSILFSILNQ
jgi:hypothetical protein